MRISAIATTSILSCLLAAVSVVSSSAPAQTDGRASMQKAMRQAMPPKAECTISPAGRAGCTYKTGVVKYTLFDAPESIQGDIYYKDIGQTTKTVDEEKPVHTVRAEESRGLEKLMIGFFTTFGFSTTEVEQCLSGVQRVYRLSSIRTRNDRYVLTCNFLPRQGGEHLPGIYDILQAHAHPDPIRRF
jgi:hypothetical protein